jgi:hypothetical protein
LAIGAGGQLTGIDIAPDGTKVVKTDTFGAYIWNRDTKRWDQLVTASSMPVSAGAHGVWEIVLAPQKTSRIFMIYDNRVYRSDDRGASWKQLLLTGISGAEANGPRKFANQKMAVDPNNPDVVYVGTPKNGAWRSFDAGATWQRLTEIAIGAEPGVAGIAFDASSGTTNGRTNTIYLPSYGKGVWRSKDAGATWQQIAGPTIGGPSSVWTAQIGADGVYWCSEHRYVWKYANDTWTKIIRPATHGVIQANAVAVDPKQPGRVIFLTDSAKGGMETLDNGATMVGDTWYAKYPAPGIGQVATDIAWLQTSDTEYFTLGDAKIDPTDGRLYIAEGIGVWWADWPKKFQGFKYTSQSLGIEQLVANDIIAPQGGHPVTASWDRPFFYSANPEVFPSKYGPVDGAFGMGWGLDYASSDPSFVVGISNWGDKDLSGYSTDGGQTWRQFAKKPEWRQGGCIAAASPTNFVWVSGNNGLPFYTKDGGATWKRAANVPADGWIFAYFLKRRIVAADRVDVGTFYLYNFQHGLFRSTDGGDTWALVYRGEIAPFSGYNARLRATPGHAGHLWFATGPQGDASTTGRPPDRTEFRRSVDGGRTWQSIPGVLGVLDFGFGKAKTAGGYPAIYIAGWVKGQYGIWRSDDEGGNWVHLGKYPDGNFDHVVAVTGDMNTYGTVYLGYSGSGFAYGTLQ